MSRLPKTTQINSMLVDSGNKGVEQQVQCAFSDRSGLRKAAFSFRQGGIFMIEQTRGKAA